MHVLPQADAIAQLEATLLDSQSRWRSGRTHDVDEGERTDEDSEADD
eukprot:COSAG01_NODE_52460_length_346_cov_1.376518_1_plen_46_part_10